MIANAYVYAISVDGIVRYVGKGSGRRARSHMKIVRSLIRRRAAGEPVSAPSRFYERLCAAYLEGCEIAPCILLGDLSHEEAFRREIEVREDFPATQLWNAGRCWDKPEYRAKQRARWQDPELRAIHKQSVAAAITAEERSARARRMASLWASSDGRARLMTGMRRSREQAFGATLMGAVLTYIRDNPGRSFSELKAAFPGRRVPNALKKLRHRGLIEKADGKFGAYFAVRPATREDKHREYDSPDGGRESFLRRS